MKKHRFLILILLVFQVLLNASLFAQSEHPTLAIGSDAPPFKLKGTDGKTYTLQSFAKAKILAVVFICNHCPTSQAYEERIKQLVLDYKDKGLSVVAISPNYPSSLRLDELGYSDVGDSFADMKVRAKDKKFNFPYLYDGATEIASRQYGPVATPHVFIFDSARKLRYNGRIDDNEDPAKTPQSFDARNAIDALLAGREVPVATTKVFGCSIKWKEKKVWIDKAVVQWAKEPVNLDTAGVAALKILMQNKTDKLRLINVWATWCVPCVQEFNNIVTLNRMFRDRGLQLVTLSADAPVLKHKALLFLQKKQASGLNYIYTGGDRYKMIETIDPKWEGALPFTLLVEPGGKVVYRHQGIIDFEEMKKVIFNQPMIGRIFK
jgi:thiol-disulfide isomerase/thioredoxin